MKGGVEGGKPRKGSSVIRFMGSPITKALDISAT